MIDAVPHADGKDQEMKFPVAIELGSDSAARVVGMPDLSSCFCARATLDEACSNTKEAIKAWIIKALEKSESLPKARAMEDYICRFTQPWGVYLSALRPAHDVRIPDHS